MNFHVEGLKSRWGVTTEVDGLSPPRPLTLTIDATQAKYKYKKQKKFNIAKRLLQVTNTNLCITS